MIKKISMLVLLATATIFSASNVIAGSCDPASEAGNVRRIDGPANIRENPDSKSKVVASLPNGSSATIRGYNEQKRGYGKVEIWYRIEWVQNGKTFSGWTHEQNIICD